MRFDSARNEVQVLEVYQAREWSFFEQIKLWHVWGKWRVWRSWDYGFGDHTVNGHFLGF